MDSSTHNALTGCVSSLQSSMQLLDSSINILDSGVSDYPRLSRVLQTTTHFELVSEHDLTTAQASLLSEIQPEVAHLLARVETHLDKLERRERSLIARAELQEGRLSRRPTQSTSPSAQQQQQQQQQKTSDNSGASRASTAAAAGFGNNSKLDEMKLQQLRQKKERLSYAVGRLELQANQRQRQLRKSMALQ